MVKNWVMTLTTTWPLKKKRLQYLSSMKSGANTRNSNKLCFFYHDTKECHSLKK